LYIYKINNKTIDTFFFKHIEKEFIDNLRFKSLPLFDSIYNKKIYELHDYINKNSLSDKQKNFLFYNIFTKTKDFKIINHNDILNILNNIKIGEKIIFDEIEYIENNIISHTE
jgi:hypothetical protein